MSFTAITANRIVKGEDLNQHGTLYAGRAAEWFMESGLMAACVYIPAKNAVCARMHGMSFASPVELGEVVKFVAQAVHAGTSSITTHTVVHASGRMITEGFITFAYVGEDNRPTPHGLTITASTPEEQNLQANAQALRVTRL